jgi:hypothetical protein
MGGATIIVTKVTTNAAVVAGRAMRRKRGKFKVHDNVPNTTNITN